MDVAVRLGEELKQTESQNRTEMKRQDQIHVFLSYARPDFDVVARLFDQLSADGFVPWMDVRCIHPGEKWDLAIKHGIKQADFFLLCLSPQSSNRRGVLQKEIRMAMDRLTELLDEDIYFIPARLVECVLPENVAAYQSVDLFKSNGYSLLVKALKEGFLRRQRRSE
jgi:hypothetical protein